MEKLSCVLDGFVYGLKEKSEFSDVRFIHSGRNRYAEKPVQSFLVACGVHSQSLVPLKGITGKLEFVVYAPSGEGKPALTDLCESMVRSLKELDTQKVIEEVYMEAAAFDSNLTVWCRRIMVKVGLRESDESEGGNTEDNEGEKEVPLTVCSQDVSGVKSFSVLCNRDFHVVRELLSGETGERLLSKEVYVLSVTLKGTQDVFAPYTNGDITVYCKETGEEFSSCSVEKSAVKVTPSGVLREYDILCPGRRKVR